MEQKVVLIRNDSCRKGEVLIPKEHQNNCNMIGSVTLKQLLPHDKEYTFKASGTSLYRKTFEMNPSDMSSYFSKEEVCEAYVLY